MTFLGRDKPAFLAGVNLDDVTIFQSPCIHLYNKAAILKFLKVTVGDSPLKICSLKLCVSEYDNRGHSTAALYKNLKQPHHPFFPSHVTPIGIRPFSNSEFVRYTSFRAIPPSSLHNCVKSRKVLSTFDYSAVTYDSARRYALLAGGGYPPTKSGARDCTTDASRGQVLPNMESIDANPDNLIDGVRPSTARQLTLTEADR